MNIEIYEQFTCTFTYDGTTTTYHGYLSPNGSFAPRMTTHRTDGPALIDSNGYAEWHIKGINYDNFKDFQKAGRLTDDQMTILKLKYGEISYHGN